MNNNIRPVPAAAAPRSGKKLRIVLMLLSILLVLLLLAWLIFPRVMNPDRIVRFFRYMGLRDKDSYGRIPVEGGAGCVYAGFDDGLLVGTENSLTLYSLDGEQKAFIQGSLPTPILRTGGDVSLCFSPGSSYAMAIGAGGATLMNSALSGSFVDADVSADGYTAYISSESGSKAVATVLNPEYKAIYRFSSRTRYLNACAISPEGRLLAVAGLEEENSIYRSGLSILRTDEALTDLEQEGSGAVRVELGNQLVYSLCFPDSSHLMALAQDELIFLSDAGERLETLQLRDEQLLDYSVSGKGWLILALSRAGGDCRVLTLDAAGGVLGEFTTQNRVRSVSAAGDYAAVLTDNDMQTYDRRLNVYDSCPDVLGATRVIARPDGTALLIGSGGTRLFIP